MECLAYEFRSAVEAGLTLCGVEEGKPQWIGTGEQFERYARNLEQWEMSMHLDTLETINY